MTSRELQQVLENLRDEGIVPASFNLNQRKTALEEELGKLVESGKIHLWFTLKSSHEFTNGRRVKIYRDDYGKITLKAPWGEIKSDGTFKEAYDRFLRTAKRELEDNNASMPFHAVVIRSDDELAT